jgi:hypothetical protein
MSGRLRRGAGCILLVAALALPVPAADASSGTGGAYLTFLFGRVQWQKAGPSCVPPSGYHTLADAVSALASHGYIGVGEGIVNYFPATGFNCISSTDITATVPKTATTGPLTVTTAAGTATAPSSFTVGAATLRLTLAAVR